MTKIIGILGGMGPLATVKFFEKIVLNTKASKDQDHPKIIVVNNTKIPDRTDGILLKGSSPLDELIKSAQLLEKSGADFIVMPCNTAHYYYKEITNNINIPFYNMLSETLKYIKDKYGNEKIGLLATTGTVKSKVYETEAEKLRIDLELPNEHQQQKIMDYIYDIKKNDFSSKLGEFLSVIEDMKKSGIKAFIFGCTELSVVIGIHDLNKFAPCIDPMDILADISIVESGCIKLND